MEEGAAEPSTAAYPAHVLPLTGNENENVFSIDIFHRQKPDWANPCFKRTKTYIFEYGQKQNLDYI